MFSNEYFRKELAQNREMISSYAEKLRELHSIDLVKSQIKQRENAEEWKDADYETRISLSSDALWNNTCVREDESFKYYSALPCPYFVHVKDTRENFFYISNSITLGNIFKYTTNLASELRYNSPEVRELTIDGDSIESVLIKKDGKNLQANISEKYLSKREHRIISNISDTLSQEQDQTIRSSKDSNSLITGPAWSGKTNALLHRMDYLISEEKINVSDLALFCFNVGLKKYLGQSVKQILGQDGVVISFDSWKEDVLRQAFIEKMPPINYENEETMWSDKDVINFFEKLTILYTSDYLKKRLLDALHDLEDWWKYLDINKFEDRWEVISKSVSGIQCFFTCWYYLLDNEIGWIEEDFTEVAETPVEKEIKLSIKNVFVKSISSLFPAIDNRQDNNSVEEIEIGTTIIREENKKNAKKERVTMRTDAFNKLVLELFGLDLVENKFSIQSIISLWDSVYPENIISKTVLSSPIIRSQLIYIIKDIVNCLPWIYVHKKKNKLFISFEHVLVDEFQDLWPHQLLLIKKFSRRWITIAWDITQSIYLEPISWSIQFDFPIHNSFKLSVTHRSTIETIQFANAILRKDNTNYDRSNQVVNSWDKPLICEIQSPDRIPVLIKQAMQKYPTSSFLVTSWMNKDCMALNKVFHSSWLSESYIASKDSWDFSRNLHISNFLQVKWLEFDFVVIIGLGDFLQRYYGKNKENILYTVLTRAKKKIIILHHWGEEIQNMLKTVPEDLYEIQKY